MVVKSALDEIEPLSFVAWRFLIGAAVLLALALPRGWPIWRHGAMAGTALFAGFALQTVGLQFTSATNSVLITTLYVVFTPFLVAIIARRPPSPWVIAGAAFSFVGVYLITGVDDWSLGAGDLFTLGCAMAFAVHIVILARYARQHPVVPFTAVQLVVTMSLAFPASWILESGPGFPVRGVWGQLALIGIVVTAGGFLLQIWSQSIVGASTAAVVFASEPVFGIAAGWLVLGERLALSGWLGAGMIVVAIFVIIQKQKDDASREAEAVTVAH